MKLYGNGSYAFRSNMSAPLGWDELSSAFDYCFQTLCVVGDALFVAVSSMPINMYSKYVAYAYKFLFEFVLHSTKVRIFETID